MQQSSDPVASLPPDVLYDTFRYLKPPLYHDISSTIKPHTLQIMSLGHVSRSWRAIAFSFPLLWDSVDLVIPHRKTHVLTELLQEWIERSGQCRLFLSLSCSLPHHLGRSESILQVLLNYSHRWYNVTFDLPMAFIRAFGEGSYNFPVLYSLSLGPLSASGGTKERDTLKFLDKAPSLRVLRVVRAGVVLTDLGHGNAFPRLTHFEGGDMRLKEMQVLLDRAPDLRYLAVEGYFPRRLISSCHPRDGESQLRVIKLRRRTTVRLLQLLPNAPSLRYLTIDLGTLPLQELLPFMERNSFRHLHTLGLATKTSVRSNELFKILSMADSVVTFFFLSTARLLRRTLVPDILNPGQPRVPKEIQERQRIILPHLENLYYVTLDPVHTPNMVDMIKRRWNGYDREKDSGTSTTNRRWAKLRSVHLPAARIVDDLEVEISEGLEVYCSDIGIGISCDSILDHEAALL